MSEFFLEVFTEEIPAKLQNDARNSLSDNFKKLFEEKKIKYKSSKVFSVPNRLVILFDGLSKQTIFKNFNELFDGNTSINQLSSSEKISIMKWRASQPSGCSVPLSLQLSKKYRIGFCGDLFEGEGFGRIEGSILSALMLVKKLQT